MDQDEYEGLVRRLEAQAHNNPMLFRSKVFLLSNAAYIVLLLFFAALSTLFYFGIYWAWKEKHTFALIKLGLAAIVMAPVFLTVLRAFLIRLLPPQGVEIHRRDAPTLFNALDTMRAKLHGPAFHRVVIDRHFNASISQVPRWGLFGGYRNHLVLGLPYLYGMSPLEMLATVAHEYGHVAGNHGKLGAWVYRQRLTFGTLQDRVRETAADNWINGLIASAVDRFAPYFNAYTFVLSRQDEYEADRTATTLVGAAPNASGLIRGDLQGRWLHEVFWPKLYDQAEERPEPAFKPFTAVKHALAAGQAQWANQEWLNAAWKIESDLHDTHPSLSDRVTAMGERPHLPPPVEITAADALLGKMAYSLARHFDQEWWSEHRIPWQQRQEYVIRSRKKLAELKQHTLSTLGLADLQEFAALAAEFDTYDTAKSILQHLLNQSGGPFPKASFLLGRILLDEGNAQGLAHLEKAAKSDSQLVEKCARSGYAYLLKANGEIAANQWWDRLRSEIENKS